MRDTIHNLSNELAMQRVQSFDPEKTDELDLLPPDQQIRRVSATSDQFTSEYRHQLAMLNLRVQSDYAELRSKYHSATRRLDALEGLVPQLRMQQQQINEVIREVRAMKRIVTDLQCAVEGRRPCWFEQLASIFERLRQFLPA